MFGILVSLYFINSLLTITIFQTLLLLLQYRESGRGRNMLQSCSLSFCLLSVLLVRCLVVRGFFGRRLTLSVLNNWCHGRFLFRLTASSCPGFPVDPSRPVPFCTGLFLTRDTSITASWRTGDKADSSSDLRHILFQAVQPFSSNALSSGAIAEPSPASVLVPSFGIFSSKLLTFRKTVRWRCKLFPLTDFCYRSKICLGDEPGKQMASAEDPRKRKINCSWRELNSDRPVANPTFYL